MCLIQNTLKMYSTYYNVTLERAMELRRSQRIRFSQGELVYIMGAIVSASRELAKSGVIFGDYRL